MSASIDPGPSEPTDYVTELAKSLDSIIGPGSAVKAKERPPGVLKINIDLLLYRARSHLREAKRRKDAKGQRELYEQAEKKFRRCIELIPQDGRAYVGLAKLLQRRGQIEEARELYTQGCDAVGGDNPFLWQAWATLEASQGELAKARRFFDAATVASSSHAAAWHGWGMLEKREGNLIRARDLFLKGARLCKKDHPNEYLFQSLALLSFELGLVEEARDYYRQGTRALAAVGRSSPALWQAWAVMEAKEKNIDAARRLFKHGLKGSPNNRFIWLAWGVTEANLNNVAQARLLLSNGATANPRDPAIMQAWARLEAQQGNLDVARKLFQQGIRVDARHQPVWQAWGVMEWTQAGDLDAARDLFQRGVWANPQHKNSARVFQAWGCLEWRAGNVQLARELFKCAVKADAKSTPSWQAWAQLEEGEGRYLKADQLRSLCNQQRTEEVSVDTSVLLAVDSVQLTVKKIQKWLQVFEETSQVSKRGKLEKLELNVKNGRI